MTRRVTSFALGALAAYVAFRVFRFVFVTGRWEIVTSNLRLFAFGTSGELGGLSLTLYLAIAGTVLAFPLGVVLALGRRSELPVVSWLSTGYIELVRGVPLITVLFFSAFALRFVLPAGTQTPSLQTRALIAIVAFTAAYVAEIVRGGLQSVPAGQTEAALALGMSRLALLRKIVLPQALRAVVPALVGQFISLLKDTSLVAIIGLTDLLRIGQTVTSQPRFIAKGLAAESLVFVSVIYWLLAFSLSKASRRLEVGST